MRRFFHDIHLYLSIPFGLIITVICLTGAILVFEDDVTAALKHDVYYSESVKANPIEFDMLLHKTDSVLPDNVGITRITVYGDSLRTCKVSLSYPRRAAVYIDRYTGEIKGDNEKIPFFDYVLRIHRWLLDDRTEDIPFTLGRRLVGISVLVFVILLVSGAVIWIPRSYKSLKPRLSIAFNKGMRRLLYDMHVSAGFYSLLFLFVLSVTGLTWSFPVYRSFVYDVFGDGKEQKTDLVLPDRGFDKDNVFDVWNSVYRRLEPLAQGREITLTHGLAKVKCGGYGNSYAEDIYEFNEETGALTDFVPYEKQSRSVKIKGWILSLHTGSWGGLPVKILVSLVSLFGATLPLTGYYLWLKKSRRKSKAK